MFKFVDKSDGDILHVATSDWPTRPGAGCILFLPGYHSTFDSDLLRSIKSYAKDNGLNIVSLEYRGHGKSPGAINDHDLHDFLHDAEFALNRFYKPAIGPLTMVGHSIGGWFATTLALRMAAQNRGQAISGVVSIAPTHSLTGPNGYMTQLLSKAGAAEQMKAHGSIPSPLGSKTNMIYTKAFGQSADELDLVYDQLGKPLPPEPRLPFPVTFIHGADDEACPRADLDGFKNRFPDSDIDIVTTYAEPAPNNPAKIWKAMHGMSRPGDIRAVIKAIEKFAMGRAVPVPMREAARIQQGLNA